MNSEPWLDLTRVYDILQNMLLRQLENDAVCACLHVF